MECIAKEKRKLLYFVWSPPWHLKMYIWTYIFDIFGQFIWHISWHGIWHSIRHISWHGISYIFWHSIWHSIWHIIFWHSIRHSFWHIPWHSIWHARHSTWHIFWHSTWHSIWHIFSHSIWHSIWHIFWHSTWHSIWHSFIWHSIWALYLSYILEFYLAVEVQQCPLHSGGPRLRSVPTGLPLGSGGPGWGPAVPLDSRGSWLRSSSAHWYGEMVVEVQRRPRERTVEVQQCPLRSGVGEEATRRGGEGGGEEKLGRVMLKSNNLHLAGGEKWRLSRCCLSGWCIFPWYFLWFLKIDSFSLATARDFASVHSIDDFSTCANWQPLHTFAVNSNMPAFKKHDLYWWSSPFQRTYATEVRKASCLSWWQLNLRNHIKTL